MLGIPGNRIRESISAMSFSHVMPGLHSDSGLSVTTVSVIESGAGSVAVFARPIFPNTVLTSGTALSRRSICWSTEAASPSEMPGGAVGI